MDEGLDGRHPVLRRRPPAHVDVCGCLDRWDRKAVSCEVQGL